MPNSKAQSVAAFLPEFAVLFCLVTATVYAAFGTAGFFDTYRDLFVAADIAQGIRFPLAGPPIYATLHLGPIWFYLLALPQKFFGISGCIVFIALLTALKFPLAMRLGWQLGGRAGAWTLLGATSGFGWSVFEPMWLNHAGIVETALFGLALSLHTFLSKPSLAKIAMVGFAAALCLHAHPTTLLFACSSCIVAIWHLRQRALIAALTLVGAAAVPFLPYLFDQVTNGFDDIAALANYGAKVSQSNSALFMRALDLVPASVFGGAQSAGRMFLWGSEIYFRAAWTALAISILGAAFALRDLRRKWLFVAVIGLLIQCLFLVAIRPETPFWMIWSSAPYVISLLALAGWPMPTQSTFIKSLRVAVISVFLMFQLACLISSGQIREEVRMPKLAPGQRGLMDVAEPTAGVEVFVVGRHYFQHLEELGQILCSPISARGHLALITERTLFVGVRNACGNLGSAILGGAKLRGSRALMGKSALWPLNWHTVKPTGGLYEVEVTGVLTQGGGLTALAQHLEKLRPAPVERDATWDGILSSGSAIAIFQYMETIPPLNVRLVLCNGVIVQPIYKELNVRIYAPCAAASAFKSNWQIQLHGGLDAIDVFGFAPIPPTPLVSPGKIDN